MWGPKSLFLGALALAMASSASAQTNPVLEHFRAYRAAIAAGDMAAAETAAAAALAASEARDGDGGRTAVLALNLASLRLELGNRVEAVAPAERAYAIASANSAAGIDVRFARLALARARLSSTVASKTELSTAMSEAAANADFSGDTYLAAIDLGRQEMADNRFRESIAAWSIAQTHAQSAPGDPTLAHAQALTFEAVALIYIAARRSSVVAQDEDRLADEKLHQALSEAYPALLRELAANELSDGVRTHAVARAWHAALSSRVSAPSWWTENHAEVNNVYSGAPGAGYCAGRIDPTRIPRYPSRSLEQFNVGSTVVAFHIEGDTITRREVLASAPAGSEFVTAVTRVYEDWRVEWAEPAEPGCTRPPYLVHSIRFYVRD